MDVMFRILDDSSRAQTTDYGNLRFGRRWMFAKFAAIIIEVDISVVILPYFY